MSGTSTGYFDDADTFQSVQGLGTRLAGAVSNALARLAGFERDRTPGVWPHLDRVQLCAGLKRRVSNPDGIDQYTSNVCGVAAVVRTWAFDSPEQYVAFALDLYLRGSARMAGARGRCSRMVRASSELKAAAPRPGMNHADWIVLASIRAALNDVFDYSPGEGIFAIKAWTTPADVEREFRAFGYTRIRNQATLSSTHGYDNLMQASHLYLSGWRVVLLIHSRLLDKATRPVVSYPDHWVGLDSAITLCVAPGPPSIYPFRVWTWAKPTTIPMDDKPVPLSTLIDNYFGFVAGLF